LKNLITDKPAPLTVALAQRPAAQTLVQLEKSNQDVLSALLGENITRGALKNLITDKPAPITVPLSLAQKSNSDVLSALLGENITRGALKNLITDKPSPITVALAQTSNPVYNPPFNNWSVNQPSPPHQSGMQGGEDIGLRNLIIDGVNGFDLVQ
jgi:hypothetical protein